MAYIVLAPLLGVIFNAIHRLGFTQCLVVASKRMRTSELTGADGAISASAVFVNAFAVMCVYTM